MGVIGVKLPQTPSCYQLPTLVFLTSLSHNTNCSTVMYPKLYSKGTVIYIGHVQPHLVTTTQHITINATYHNWSHNMSQLTQVITILTQDVTTQQRNLSQEFQFFCNMSQRNIEILRLRYII